MLKLERTRESYCGTDMDIVQFSLKIGIAGTYFSVSPYSFCDLSLWFHTIYIPFVISLSDFILFRILIYSYADFVFESFHLKLKRVDKARKILYFFWLHKPSNIVFSKGLWWYICTKCSWKISIRLAVIAYRDLLIYFIFF